MLRLRSVSIASAAVVALATLGHSAARAEEPGERVVAVWDFTGAPDPLGWTALHSVQPLAVADGALRVVVSASDPYIGSPALENARTEPGALVRITARCKAGGRAEVFWAAAESAADAQFRGGDEIGVILPDGDNWTTVTTALPWKAGLALRQLRFDAPEGVGLVVEIRRIELVVRPLPPDLPNVPSYSFSQPGLALAFMPGPGMDRVFGEGSSMVCVTGGDPAIVYSPEFDLATDAAGIASVSVRASAPGRVDVLYKRKGVTLFPPGEGTGIDLPQSTDFRILNLDLRSLPTYKGGIQQLALRFSGMPVGGRIEVQSLAVMDRPRGGPLLQVVECSPPGSVCAIGPTLDVRCRITNAGGRGSRESLLMVSTEPKLSAAERIDTVVPSIAPLQSLTLPVRIPIGPEFAGGPVRLAFRLRSSPVRTVTTFVGPVPGPDVAGGDPSRAADAFLTPEGHAVLRNGLVCLVFPKVASGYRAGILYDVTRPKPATAGSFPSLARTAAADGQFSMVGTADTPLVAAGPVGAQLTFPVSLHLGDVDRAASVRFVIRPGEPEVECSLRIAQGTACKVSGILFPDFLAGDGAFAPQRDLGLFPGLEYLLPGEVSSGTDFADPSVSDRVAPHPYKVTIPGMWVTYRGATVGLRWDPVREWARKGLYPTPVFSSPDRLLNSPGHRMGLCVPGVLGGGRENRLVAPPMDVAADDSPELAGAVFIAGGEDVEAPIRYIIRALYSSQAGAAPPLPSPAPSPETIVERAACALARTLWIPTEKKWHPNIPDAFGPGYGSAYVSALRFYALTRPDGQLAPEAAAVARDALAAQRERGGGVGWEIAFTDGGLEGAVAGIVAQGKAVAQAIRADGTWPYAPASGLHAAFGLPGDTSSGLTAANAMTCLRAAELTQDPDCLKAGLAALAYLGTQARPEGAQTWELSLHVPDVLACANAVDVLILAHKLTGDPAYLESAKKWAWRAMPFIYAWAPPSRPVMRYGSIPVFGASNFTGAWFGRIVQWNGIEVAHSLLDLAPLDPSFDWATVARGIFLSGGQQMRPISRELYDLADYVPDTGHPGTYPDSYDPIAGTDSYTWDLEPSRLAAGAIRILGRGGVPHTEIVRSQAGVATITGLGVVSDLALRPDGVSCAIALTEVLGPHTVAVSGLATVTGCECGGTALQPAGPDVLAVGTYRVDAGSGMVYVRLAPSSTPVPLVIRGTPAQLPTPAKGGPA